MRVCSQVSDYCFLITLCVYLHKGWAIFSTVILSLSEFVLCVLRGGGSEGVRSVEGEGGEEEKGGLRDLIIQRIDHPNDDVGFDVHYTIQYIPAGVYLGVGGRGPFAPSPLELV